MDGRFAPESTYGDNIMLPSALGAKIYWSEDSLPSVREPVIKQDSDIDSIRDPDPQHDGYLAWYLKTLALFLKQKDDFEDNFHFIKSIGPGELASHLWGLQEVLINTRLKPELTRILLNKLTDIIITWLDAQLKVNPSAEGLLLSDDIAGLMGKEAYLDLLYPLHLKIREKYKDFIMVFHCDTKADHLLDSFASLGINVFNFGSTTDIAVIKKRIGGKITLMGNLDPVAVLKQGDTKTVKEISRRCIKIAGQGGGYILSAGGGVNDGTPPENIDAMVQVAKG